MLGAALDYSFQLWTHNILTQANSLDFIHQINAY